MKILLWLYLASFTCLAFVNLKVNKGEKRRSGFSSNELQAYKLKNRVGCAPDLSSIDLSDPANSIPLLQGWGKYRMPVTYTNDSAYIYFQQGINMYYGFHIIEALASFEKAAIFDSSFAMAYWGKALAYGPNINDLGYAASPDALNALRKAKALCNNCTPVEKALIDAMQTRYAADSTEDREVLNQRYADAMKRVHNKFPESADAAALYADALMVQHPWDLYDRHMNPKPWTPEIVRVLEGLTRTFPENPGANHYYIHAIEGSKNPEKALNVANRLGSYMPGVAHLVHMPSHIYIRAGNYKKGVAVNEAAVKGYQEYLSKFPLVANGSFIYLIHNLHMKAACAAMDADYPGAARYSAETRSSIDTPSITGGGYFDMYAQYLFTTPLLTQIRFGRWDEVLQTPDFPEAWVYARSLQHFGKGLAHARNGAFDKALKALADIDDSINSSILQEHPPAFNPGSAAVNVAKKVLQGVIAEEKGNYSEAIALFQEAVNLEDGMLYNEPKDWLLPVRQYLGSALLKAKQFKAAEKVYKEDLSINPNNVWSLIGLMAALKGEGKTKQAGEVMQAIRKITKGNSLAVTSSVY